jgi:hypothetical protein
VNQKTIPRKYSWQNWLFQQIESGRMFLIKQSWLYPDDFVAHEGNQKLCQISTMFRILIISFFLKSHYFILLQTHDQKDIAAQTTICH